jgi:hypothetical protein
MTKKDFKANLGVSVKTQDIADKDRFGKADSVLSNLDAATDKQRQAEQSTPSKTLVVRHTFSMSESDYTMLDTLRRAAEVQGMRLSASDICRIGIHAIRDYSADEVIAAVDKLEQLKPGRRS